MSVRYVSPERAMEEVKLLVDMLGARAAWFCDDTFTANQDFVYALCDALSQENLDIQWVCQTRVDQIDKQLLETMKNAGLRAIGFGVETASQDILEKTRKHTSLEQARTAFAECKKLGIETQALLMFGFPWEQWDDCMKTIVFAQSLAPDYSSIFSFVPFPGTEFFETPQQFGVTLESESFSDFLTLGAPIISTQYLTRQMLAEVLLIAHCCINFNRELSSVKPIREGVPQNIAFITYRGGGLLYDILSGGPRSYDIGGFRGKMVELDGIGIDIVSSLFKGKSIGEISCDIASEYEKPSHEIERDITEFVTELIQKIPSLWRYFRT